MNRKFQPWDSDSELIPAGLRVGATRRWHSDWELPVISRAKCDSEARTNSASHSHFLFEIFVSSDLMRFRIQTDVVTYSLPAWSESRTSEPPILRAWLRLRLSAWASTELCQCQRTANSKPLSSGRYRSKFEPFNRFMSFLFNEKRPTSRALVMPKRFTELLSAANLLVPVHSHARWATPT